VTAPGEPYALMRVLSNKAFVALQNGDPTVLALRIFHDMDSLRPLAIPALPFEARALAKAECARRLRTTMWAETKLRAAAAHKSYADMLAAFHRTEWAIAQVADGMDERETQIANAVRQKGR
jgi:hypothetical protein